MERSLAPADVAIFDLNSLLAYRTTFAVDSVHEDGDLVFAWRGRASADAQPGCEAAPSMDVFAPAEAGL